MSQHLFSASHIDVFPLLFVVQMLSVSIKVAEVTVALILCLLQYFAVLRTKKIVKSKHSCGV
jgi:hypothetical protein